MKLITYCKSRTDLTLETSPIQDGRSEKVTFEKISLYMLNK